MDPILTEEWIYHALGSGREDVAARQGGRLIRFLRDNLAYLESKRIGEWILVEKQQPLATGDDAFLLNEFGFTIDDLGEHQKAIGYYEQALAIDRAVFGVFCVGRKAEGKEISSAGARHLQTIFGAGASQYENRGRALSRQIPRRALR